MKHIKYVIILSFLVQTGQLFSQDPRIEPQYLWRDYSTRTDWGAFIAFDYFDVDGFFDLAISNFDKTIGNQLTKDVPGLPQRHIGNPTYHPSGRYIIFQALKDTSLGGPENRAWFTYAVDAYKGSPGKGIDNDLWCVDLLDVSFYRLTTLPTKKSLLDTTKISGVLHPHFSKDGTRVLWAQSFDLMADIGGRGKWGLWQLNISDFVVAGGIPSLQNTMSYRPGGLLGDFTWVESHGWTQNDSVIIFSMNGHGQHEDHMDIYTLNVFDSTLSRLTDDPRVWDEHAHPTHDGEKLLYISSASLDFDTLNPDATLKTDYWIMDMDGKNKERVTFFNDPTHPDYLIHGGQRVICADASFSSTGDSILINTKVPDDTVNQIYEKIMFATYNHKGTGIEFSEKISKEFILNQNYPNPFNAATKISYSIVHPNFVSLKIYDILGREIQSLVDTFQQADAYSVTLDTRGLASGIYFYKLQVGARVVETKKMMLLR